MSLSQQVIPQDFSEVRWRGHWIWVPEERITPGGFISSGHPAPAKAAHGLFRKTFELAHVPQRVPSRITADSRYALFVNGQEVSRGPIRSQPRRMYYDLVDLAPYLKTGSNIIAIYVTYYGSPKAFWMPASANVMLGKTGVLVFEADLGEAGWLVSDPTWKAHKSEAWTELQTGEGDVIAGGIPVELFDARLFSPGWQHQDFDDTAWGTAQVIPAIHIGGYARTQPPTDPYGPLYPRPIAHLAGELQTPASARVEWLSVPADVNLSSPIKRIEALYNAPIARTQSVVDANAITVKTAAGQTARVVIDMGRIVSGMVQFEVVAPAGTVLDFAYKEDPITGPANFISSQSGTRYIARGSAADSPEHFEVFDSNGFRYAYVLVHDAAGSIQLNHFAVQERLYPWQAGASFECNDAYLNKLYQACIRTVQLNSHDAFMDCPTREQRAWVGDSVVHQMVHLATNADWRLAWHYLTLSNSPRPDGIMPMSVVGEIESGGGVTIPDWSLHWVHGVYNLYRFAGDTDAVKAFMPTIERVLRWYVPYQTSAGVLKDVVEWNLIDWASVSNEDTSAVITAIWARGLHEFAEMAAWLEERASQRWAEGIYAKVQAGFEAFWDEARGTYIDHIKNGAPQPEVSQLAGALAICAELAPRERWAQIIDTITDESKLVVRSWSGGDGEYVAEKMAKTFQGIYEPDWGVHTEIVIAQPFMSYVVHDAVAQAGLAERLPQLFQRWAQFFEGGYDTIGECWGWGTHVHGWSCAPARDLMFYVLGVMPAEPGYTVVRIAPRLGSITHAEATVPTPNGLVHLEISPERLRIESPVPVQLVLDGQAARRLSAGVHEVLRAID